MRKSNLLCATFGALTLIASPAFAQDEDDAFDGAYIGVSGGYSVQNNDVGEGILFDGGLDGSYGDVIRTAAGANAFSPGFCNGAATSNANTACRNDRDDFEYHVRLGADQQIGNFAYGAVAEFGKSNLRDSVSAFSTTPAFYTMTREIEWNAALRARAGYVAGNQVLFYGTFGGSYAKLDHSFSSSNTANSFAVTGDDGAWGWQAGGGVEAKVGRNFSLGLEYLYNRYLDDESRVRVGTGTAGATNPFVLAGGADFARTDGKFDYHSIRATASFRF